MFNNEPNEKPMTLKEFIAIMVAAVMIITPLILTNQPRRSGTPIYLGQLQMGSERMDTTQDSMWASDKFTSERVATPGSDTQWTCGWGSWWSKWTHALGGMFHVYLN